MTDIRVRGVLLDLCGVVYVGDIPLPGALAAIQRLRQAGLGLRFLTNTTRRSTLWLLADLAVIGLDLAHGCPNGSTFLSPGNGSD